MSTAAPERVFAALADPSRRQVLENLADHVHGASATTLAAPLTVSRQAVDRHLRVLQEAGLVASARHGREVRYTVRREELESTADWLHALARRWDRQLASVKAAAEAATRPDERSTR